MKSWAILCFLWAGCCFSFGQSSGRVGYAPYPNDPYFHFPSERFQQWYLENRAVNGVRTGIDMNAREAWATTQGAGVVIAIVDNGVDLGHQDLEPQQAAGLHYNFDLATTDGNHPDDFFNHGTPVAGLAVARGNDGKGIVGMAPQARFASWVIFTKVGHLFVPPAKLAEMFQSHINEVGVQNHSWVKTGEGLTPMSTAEAAAIERAVTEGRNGRGVIMVRAGGNARAAGRNANDDAYVNDPRAIAVGAVWQNGRFNDYSNPGANILVSAPGGIAGDGLFTTDRRGSLGLNGITFPAMPDLSDYVFRSLGFNGTSSAAPLVSGVAALVISANPQLTYRDVQQIFIHASNPLDAGDPDTRPNAAGYFVNHNTGFGVLDAGRAVELAKRWVNRPLKVVRTVGAVANRPIVDGGLYLRAVAGELSTNYLAAPSYSVYPNETTPLLPGELVGQAVTVPTASLSGKAALIDRGGAPFATKLLNVAQAGAEFAVMLNNQSGDDLLFMGGTDLVPIPSVLISQNSGVALKAFIAAQPGLRVQLVNEKTVVEVPVLDSLVAEHVGVRIRTSHQRRGDLRIVLVSPTGTRSVLHGIGPDDDAGPVDWIYYSTHHFYEQTAGTWKVEFTDQLVTNSGSVESVELILHGVPVVDLDRDGLGDEWELLHFTSLNATALGDPDQDGILNAREQVLGTSPVVNDIEFALSAAVWKKGYIWLSWPSYAGSPYRFRYREQITSPSTILATVPGEWQRTHAVLPSTEAQAVFFTIDANTASSGVVTETIGVIPPVVWPDLVP